MEWTMWDDLKDRDLNLRNSLFLLLYRSPIFCGEIKNVKIPEELPAGCSVISYQDLPQKEFDILGSKIPLLCDRYVNYQGEPIFIIAAKSRSDAEAVSKLIQVEYQPSTPFFFDNDLKENQVIKERNETWTYDDKPIDPEQVLTVETTTSGDLYKPVYNDPIGVAISSGAGSVSVCTSTQWPHHVRSTVSSILNMPEEDVKVNVPQIASPLEGRLWFPSYLAALAASVMALRPGESVNLILTKEEVQQYIGAQYPFKIKHTSMVDKNTGAILQCTVDLSINAGAYPLFADEVMENALISIMGPYKVNKVIIREQLIKTSYPPMFFITGNKFTQMLVGIETHINNIISQTEQFPDEWRLENTVETSAKAGNIVIEKVTRNSDFQRKFSAYDLAKQNRIKGISSDRYYRGIGLAFATYKATSGFSKKIATPFTGTLTLNDNWQIHYSTATVPQNFFEYTLWKKVIHKATELEEASIHIMPHDTASNEDSIPDILGEMTKGPIQLVQKCCRKLQELRISTPLPIKVEESYDPTDDINAAVWGAAIVEVSVDIITYKPSIKGIWTCFDVGDTIDEDISKRYLMQRIINSLYWCNSQGEDELSSWKYANLPISISLINSKGADTVNYCGDIPFGIIPAAYCNAISQAVGKVITDMPVTPEKLYRMVEEQ
ncbi:MAG: xanthine dehydrogenase family protein molybdopterin-binding subunit [Spirochaetia bacterium]|nr:xanthine dehydrogenase family protein molybdopterin-binding subunit [Spirochaetia bacterium]